MSLPNMGLKLFNTLTGRVEDFAPLDMQGQQVKMYVCGPTVYDDAHLGHARCYITWDVLYRFLKFMGYNVTYVRNVTDVDDKILNRAKERGETPAQLAERNYQSFQADMQALNVLPPDEEPRATQYIEEMLTGIQALIEKGAAYTTPDGSAYFRVAAKADYGKLKYATQDTAALKKQLDDLKAGARVEAEEGKESPLDFALWKSVPLSDPNGWESPWAAKGMPKGWGRPGWHMECSAMNHAVFGDQIDIHAGGADLIFPHHENEIAQSEAWTGKQPFAKYWLHNGFVNVSGEKMSKSLGNFSTIKKVLERYDANTIRYFLLTNHYRMPVDFNDEALEGPKNRIERIHKVMTSLCQQFNFNENDLNNFIVRDQQQVSSSLKYLNKFLEVMQDDLNTAQALSYLNSAFSDVNKSLGFEDESNGKHEGKAQDLVTTAIQDFVSIFANLGFDIKPFFQQASLPADEIRTIYKELTGEWMEADKPLEECLKAMVQLRKRAKEIKNWAQADAIRKHLTDIGLQILDNKDGTTSVEKDGLEIARA